MPTNEEAVTFVQVARQLSVEPLVFANFLQDHTVTLSAPFAGLACILRDLISLWTSSSMRLVDEQLG